MLQEVPRTRSRFRARPHHLPGVPLGDV